MDIIGIYLFDQNTDMAFVKARCTHIPLVLIFLGEMQLSVVKLRSALSPLASCCCSEQLTGSHASHALPVNCPSQQKAQLLTSY